MKSWPEQEEWNQWGFILRGSKCMTACPQAPAPDLFPRPVLEGTPKCLQTVPDDQGDGLFLQPGFSTKCFRAPMSCQLLGLMADLGGMCLVWKGLFDPQDFLCLEAKLQCPWQSCPSAIRLTALKIGFCK